MSYSNAETRFGYVHHGHASNDALKGLQELAAGLKELTAAIKQDLSRIKAELQNLKSGGRYG